ncbi:MAG: Homoserine O-acetyltransferase [Chloroflexota bacterium]|nr:Homoserine O-acetyltransferase [Chloroflexota bacterium]
MAPTDTRVPGGTVLPGPGHSSNSARHPLGTGRLETADLGAFALESGATLPLTVAYRHDGPGPDSPQVLVIHALTGSADAAGDWWAPLIGPGRAFDTSRVGVLCTNLLGGRYGSTGPTSINPVTGEPWGADFPQPTARDEARAIWRLADALGLRQFALVGGGSLGGMISLEVALERPHAVRHVVPIGAPAATGPMAIAWNHIQLGIIERLGHEGLSLARQLAMTTYRSTADFDGRFGRQVQVDGRFAVVSYLDHQGGKILDRFDPDTYSVLVRVMDGHDVGRDRGGIVAAFRSLAAAGAGLTGIGIEGDILYGPDQVRLLVGEAAAAGVDATYVEIETTKGHDGFLIEWDQLARLLGAALADGLERDAGEPGVTAVAAT